MSTSMPLLRTTLRRTAIPRRAGFRPAVRHQSTTNSSHTAHVLSGLAGGALVLAGGYAVYSYSAAGRLHSSINASAKSAKEYYSSAANQFSQSTPDANEAIEYLRKTAYGYAAFIPGGRGYVDTAFKDLDAVREKHGDKVEEIVKDGYQKLQAIAKEVGTAGVSVAAATKVFEVLSHVATKLGSEAVDASESVLGNHPQLKEKVGGQLEQLKTLGDKFGPEAKEKADAAWREIGETLRGGLSADNVAKVKKLVEDKVQELQKYGDQAWQEGLKQVQPYLDKNPKVKELVEQNADALKRGDAGELWAKVKKGVESGDIGDLKKYVESASQAAQEYAQQGWDEILKQAQPYLEKNPKIKELVEQNKDVLKKGDAKELFERVKKSVESGDVGELKGYVEEAKKQARQYGEQAFDEILKQAQPYLEKNPKIKQLVEDNKDALKKGDAKELFERVKKSADSGKLEDLKGYVEEVAGKSK